MYPIYSSKHFKCCNKTIHESCLLKWAIIQQSNQLTCPFCRAHIVDIFEYIPLTQISQMLINWKCDHNIVVRGKNTQIMIASNPIDLVNRTSENEDEVEAQPGPTPSPTTPRRLQEESTATITNGDKGVFWCFLGSFIVIIAIMIIIIIITCSS